MYAKEKKYWIRNICEHFNGWCFREHIYGILYHVKVMWQEQYYSRPFPKSVFEKVRDLVKEDRWSPLAKDLCEPDWETPPE